MITITNTSTAEVAIVSHELNLRRTLKPGQKTPLKPEELEFLSFDQGFQNLSKAGFIKVEGEEVIPGTIEEPAGNVVTTPVLREIFQSRDISKFATIIKDSTPATRDAIVKLAIEYSVTEPAFAALIKKYCDVDIIEAVSVNHKANEPMMESK